MNSLMRVKKFIVEISFLCLFLMVISCKEKITYTLTLNYIDEESGKYTSFSIENIEEGTYIYPSRYAVATSLVRLKSPYYSSGSEIPVFNTFEVSDRLLYFSQWETSPQSSTTVDALNSVSIPDKITGDLTLYAIYVEGLEEFNITLNTLTSTGKWEKTVFSVYDGNYFNSGNSTYTELTNSVLTLESPFKPANKAIFNTGETIIFSQWQEKVQTTGKPDEKNAFSLLDTPIDRNITLYAAYTQKGDDEYNVEFRIFQKLEGSELRAGKYASQGNIKVVKGNIIDATSYPDMSEEIVLQSSYLVDGTPLFESGKTLVFVQWLKKAQITSAVSPSDIFDVNTPITEDIILYASYRIVQVSLDINYLDAQGNNQTVQFVMDKGSAINTMNSSYETAVNSLVLSSSLTGNANGFPASARLRYAQLQYTAQNDGSLDSNSFDVTTALDEDTILYVAYIQYFIVTFNYFENNGEISTMAQEVDKNLTMNTDDQSYKMATRERTMFNKTGSAPFANGETIQFAQFQTDGPQDDIEINPESAFSISTPITEDVTLYSYYTVT